jgi:pyroglutamyl-peptidase
VLPVVAGRCVELAWWRAQELRPAAILCLGQSGKARELNVERLAVNVNHFSDADNAGGTPHDELIIPDGPAAYFTTIPSRQVVETLTRHGVPARLSYHAGTFVCNHLLYGLLHQTARSGLAPAVGFIHVPLLPGQVGKPGEAEGPLPLDQLAEGVRQAITVCAAGTPA